MREQETHDGDDDFFGSLRDRIAITGDITVSIASDEIWETEREWVELCRENPPRPFETTV